MATTKIWEIRDSLSRVVSYAENPQKTALSDLESVLDYAQNDEKTADEQVYLVTGVVCSAENAAGDMLAIKERFGKTGGIVAMHGYQSFHPGEVTPKQCHELGVRLAKELWGGRYQVLVATHMNTDCCHNHFVINTVSYIDGAKFPAKRTEYYRMREASDRLCREYGLSVIDNPSGARTPRKIYQDERDGKPTLYNNIRDDIDSAILATGVPQRFRPLMEKMGYTFAKTKAGNLTIHAQGMKYPVSLARLGEDYEWPSLYQRIYESPLPRPYAPISVSRYQMRFRGSFGKARKITGLRALYYHYLYKMGILPEHKQHKPFSPEMREALRRLDRYSEQARLLAKYKLDTPEHVTEFIAKQQTELDRLGGTRRRIDNRRRRCDNAEQKAELSAARSEITAVMTPIRKELRTAKGILEEQERIKELIRIETETQLSIIGQKDRQKTRTTNRKEVR